MSGKFGEVKLRNVGSYFHNFKFSSISQSFSRWIDMYQAKYVHVKNARMTPFFHIAGACMLVNYLIAYNYHLKYEKNRKYH